MNDSELYRLLADVILLIHFLIVAFIVVGFTAIVTGKLLGWRWVRNRKFRIAHLIAIGIVVLQAWLGKLCPLTIWESALRQKAGQSGYTESFIEHWLHRIMFFEAEPWVFVTVYTVFGALVLATWLTDRNGKGGT